MKRLKQEKKKKKKRENKKKKAKKKKAKKKKEKRKRRKKDEERPVSPSAHLPLKPLLALVAWPGDDRLSGPCVRLPVQPKSEGCKTT